MVYECFIWILISHEIEIAGKTSDFNHSCHPHLQFLLPALSQGGLNGAEHPLFYFYLFLKTLLMIYLSVPVCCSTAPRRGCSVLWGSVLLPLKSTNTACASVVVTPEETGTEWTPQGITPYQLKTSNLQSDSFFRKCMQRGSHCFFLRLHSGFKMSYMRPPVGSSDILFSRYTAGWKLAIIMQLYFLIYRYWSMQYECSFRTGLFNLQNLLFFILSGITVTDNINNEMFIVLFQPSQLKATSLIDRLMPWESIISSLLILYETCLMFFH